MVIFVVAASSTFEIVGAAAVALNDAADLRCWHRPSMRQSNIID